MVPRLYGGMWMSEKTQQRDKMAKEALLGIIERFYDQFEHQKVPNIVMPTRTKANIEYNNDSEVWVYGDSTSTRSAKTVKGANQILKMSYVVELLIKEHLENNRGSTLRELYYISENWDIAKFNEQPESDRMIEDLEIISALQREYFHMRPEEDGATLFGSLKLKETTKRGERIIHCRDDVGEGGYQIPFNVENVEFLEHDAKFIIAIETGGMHARLIENGFDEEFNAIQVHLKGQPARSTRRMLKRLNEELNIPVVVFTDGDPWSYRIFASVAYGAIKSAHMSEFMATPAAKFIGVQPSDIVDYDLSTDKLTDQDIKALRSELTDPRFDSDYWKNQIQLQLDIGKKAEQQAFAGKGLDFVTQRYLPERLTEMGII
jgi:DNA topoisomerase-6 subunit A